MDGPTFLFVDLNIWAIKRTPIARWAPIEQTQWVRIYPLKLTVTASDSRPLDDMEIIVTS